MPRSDYCIIGAGVIGMAIAREIAIRSPSSSVTLIEKEADVALHASGRNSGVLHAGFYYSPDSLKARLTAEGNQLLRTFCADHGVPVRSCGKVVVTSTPEQLPALHELHRRGRANGVELHLINESELRDLEPLARTVGEALWSPHTAVADPSAVAGALLADIQSRGVVVELGTRVVGAEKGRIRTERGELQVGHVVNAAGLYADAVGRWFGFCDDYEMLPFKGLYWYGGPAAPPLRRHVYPVPDPRNPFLGVHFTVTASGGVKVGPTAIPVLWREAYRRGQGFDRGEMASILREFPRFLRSEHHDVPGLIRTELPKYSRRMLVRSGRELVPSATARAFSIRGRPGIRAQLVHRESGRLEMDFVIRGDESSTHVLNAVSPAWTGSLAFASLVAEQMAANDAI